MFFRVPVLLFCVLFFIAACGGGKKLDFRDRRAPQIVSVSPADGSVDVPTGTEVTVVYDEALRTQNFDFTSFQVVGVDGKAADGFLALNNDQIIFRASKPYDYATLYTVRLTSNIRDLFGNRSKPFEATFTTVPDREPPSAPYNLVYSPLTNLATTVISGAKEPGATIKINDAKIATSAASAVFEVTVQLPAEGDNTFRFKAIDAAGNESVETQITIKRDQVAPTGLSACAGAGSLAWHYQGREGCWVPPGLPSEPLYWNNIQLPVGGVWNPGVDEVAFIRLGEDEFTYADSSFALDLLTPPPLAFGIPDGPVPLVIGARDLAGNVTKAIERTFIYDDSPPTLFLNTDALNPFGGSQVAAVTNTTLGGILTFTKGDDHSSDDVDYFATLDGVPNTACAASASTCYFPFDGLADGLHRFSISATDTAGNTTRILKMLTVDTAAPTAVVVPISGATTGFSPTLHVFTQEPVTASVLTLTGPDPEPLFLDAVEDTAALRTHWSFTSSMLTIGAHSASVSLRDAAGNAANITWNFDVTGDPVSSATAGYVGMITQGSRNGNFTVFGMPTTAVNVLRIQQSTGSNVDLFATATTQVSAVAEPLSMLFGSVYSYNADGVATEFALPITVWNDSTPRMVGTFFTSATVPFPVYGTAITLPGPNLGFTLFADFAYRFQVEDGGPKLGESYHGPCSGGGRYPTFPLLEVSPSLVLAGQDCLNAESSVYELALSDYSRTVLWTGPAEDTAFGTAIAGGDLFGDGTQAIIVGSPEGTSGRGAVYVYANAAATTPVLQLSGPSNDASQFGGSIAIARNHLPGTASLAAIDFNEAAVYFYDGATLRDALTLSSNSPIATYRMRSSLPSTQNCVGAKNRQEVISPGDMDGDGSDDFVTASWGDDCPTGSLSYREHLVSLRIFLGGPGASGDNPIVINQGVTKRRADARPRLLSMGDLNGDGLADFGYVDAPRDGLHRVFYGTTSGTPRQTLLKPFTNNAPLSWTLAGMMDGNADGYPDFILTRYESGLDLKQMVWP